MTLWESSETKLCTWCGKTCRVWSPWEAYGRGESTFKSIRTDKRGDVTNYIDPSRKGYEDVCDVCASEDINFRYNVAMAEMYEAKGTKHQWI